MAQAQVRLPAQNSAITQFFFEAKTFFRFRDADVAAGDRQARDPGRSASGNWGGTRRFAAACGTGIPPHIAAAFEAAAREGSTASLATELATELCEELLEGGSADIHFYTLNRPELTTCGVRGAWHHRRLPRLESVA